MRENEKFFLSGGHSYSLGLAVEENRIPFVVRQALNVLSPITK